MSTDTTTLAPTDAEIADLWAVVVANRRSSNDHPMTAFARAVLAKWGAPAPANFPARITALLHEVKRGPWEDASGEPLQDDAAAALAWIAAPPAQEARDGCTLSSRIAELTEQHGSLRAAARSLDFDPGYLARLQSGEKCNPSPALLERLGLRQVITYERGTT